MFAYVRNPTILIHTSESDGARHVLVLIERLSTTPPLIVEDPTAAAVAWVVYWVHAHPDVLERPRGEPGAQSSSESFLDLVCKETLRIVPIKVMLASLLCAVELAAPRRRLQVDQRGATLARSQDLRLRIEKVMA